MREAGEGGVSAAVAKKVGGGHTVADCQIMHRMLQEHALLAKPTYRMENGIKITICPPARAHGVWVRARY